MWGLVDGKVVWVAKGGREERRGGGVIRYENGRGRDVRDWIRDGMSIDRG
jgi:hypothetical protein